MRNTSSYDKLIVLYRNITMYWNEISFCCINKQSNQVERSANIPYNFVSILEEILSVLKKHPENRYEIQAQASNPRRAGLSKKQVETLEFLVDAYNTDEERIKTGVKIHERRIVDESMRTQARYAALFAKL